MHCEKYASPLGPLWLTGTEVTLTGLSFAEPQGEYLNGNFPAARSWLDDYFLGNPREIDFPVEPSGTPFQKLIWQLLLAIPYGKTVSYGALAEQAAVILGKNTMSAQAVGQAVGKNPIAILIPCHRVVGAKGKLTGYAWGIGRKQWLLNHEQEEK